MGYRQRREMLCINAIAWAGALGVVGLVALDIREHSLNWSSSGVGFIFASVFFGLLLVSGRGLSFGALLVAAVAGGFPLWAEPGAMWFTNLLAGMTLPSWLMNSMEILSLPIFMVCVSAFMGLLLAAATTSRGVGIQTVLAGFVAGGCLMAPGEPTIVLGAAGVLWNLIVYLSLSSWARDYAARASRNQSAPALGQSGPLASLVRGSTKQELRRSNAA